MYADAAVWKKKKDASPHPIEVKKAWEPENQVIYLSVALDTHYMNTILYCPTVLCLTIFVRVECFEGQF